MPDPISQFTADRLDVLVYPSEAVMGHAAARSAAEVLRRAVADRGHARAVFATGNSQLAFIAALHAEDVPWDRVTVFHLDEYVGLDAEHPAGFRRWIRERVQEPFSPGTVEYIDGNAPDTRAECDRYEALLRQAPLDLVCLGIGENGHLAFNEPLVADFEDQRWVRVITLTPESRAQQVREGHFASDDAVPSTAISLTIPPLLSATHVQVCVPERRKAAAVATTLRAKIGTACPATILRSVGHARLYLEPDSASEIERPAAGVST